MATSATSGRSAFPLGRRNLVILGLGAVSLVAGYLLLSAGSTTPASILLVLGYCVLVPVGLDKLIKWRVVVVVDEHKATGREQGQRPFQTKHGTVVVQHDALIRSGRRDRPRRERNLVVRYGSILVLQCQQRIKVQQFCPLRRLAYGVAVATTMLATTLFLYFVARHIWGWQRWSALALAFPFLCIDSTFFTSNLAKIPAGGWLPVLFATVSIFAAFFTATSDRSLLLGLPPLAAMAAFALPTLKRSVASLIDWFTLIFFTSCSLVVWVVWIAMQTGTPRQPAANVARLAPGFEPSFSVFAFLVAIAATLAWAWLVRWRAGAHRAAVWKSLVLPAGGATLCWILLMTLWLPLLDYARSYAALSRQVAGLVNKSACVEIYGISNAQAAALQYHGGLNVEQPGGAKACPFLIVDADAQASMSRVVNLPNWAFMATLSRPTDKTENVLLFKRVSASHLPARSP